MRELVVAAALFVVIGVGMRYLFREWIGSVIKKASAESKLKASEWKPVQTNFSELKLKPIVNPVQLYDPKKSPISRTKR